MLFSRNFQNRWHTHLEWPLRTALSMHQTRDNWWLLAFAQQCITWMIETLSHCSKSHVKKLYPQFLVHVCGTILLALVHVYWFYFGCHWSTLHRREMKEKKKKQKKQLPWHKHCTWINSHHAMGMHTAQQLCSNLTAPLSTSVQFVFVVVVFLNFQSVCINIVTSFSSIARSFHIAFC